MGYALAAVLSAVFIFYILKLRGKNKAQEEKLRLLEQANGEKERLLTRKQEEFAAFCNSLQEGVVLLDGQRRVFRNQKARRLENVTEGDFSCEGRQYYGQALLDGRLLLIHDVTEQEQAEKMRQELTANVSHELKTPLHAISGYAEMMTQGMVKPEDMAGFAGNIYKEAGRMIRLVEDILNLSRLDGGQGYEWEELDLYEKARHIVELLRPLANKAGVSLILSGRSCRLRAIDQLLGMLIHNLIDNAIKYNKPGGRVEVLAVDGVLTVVDTGIGIPRQAQSRVFERFYRVDKSRSKAVGGTGLGLSIVKHAARLMNAAIELQSDEGQGTTVTVRFEY